MFEEYELICEEKITVTLEKIKLASSKIVYKIKNNYGDVTLVQDDKETILGKCRAIKNVSNNKKKKWWKILFGK